MNAVKSTLRGLVERRLWPVALLLAGAAAAVPVLLASDPAPAPAPAAGAKSAVAADTTSIGAPALVSVAAATSREKGRQVKGARKDPFAPAPVKVVKAKAASTDDAAGARTDAASSSSSGSTSAGSGGSSASPSATPAATPTPSYPLYSLRVRWSAASDENAEVQTLERLAPLPDADTPLVIYLGLLEDGKTAVFLLDSTVTPDGDGKCTPSPKDCQTLHLKAGETAFFDVAAADGTSSEQYELDVVSIKAGKTTSRTKAKAAYVKEATSKSRSLRARAAGYGYDAATGRFEKLPAKTLG